MEGSGSVSRSRMLPYEVQAASDRFRHQLVRSGANESALQLNNYNISLLDTLDRAIPGGMRALCLLADRMVERNSRFGPFLDTNVHRIMDSVVEDILEQGERELFHATVENQSFSPKDFPSMWLRYRWTVIEALLSGNEHALKELGAVDYYSLSALELSHSRLSTLISAYIEEGTDMPMSWWLNLNGWGSDA